MTPIISTHQVTKQYGSNLALDRLSLTIEQGEVFGFLGHNGAGKTTTVRLLNGVLFPTSGEISVLGMDPTQQGNKIRARTGVLTETPALDDRLTARATLRYYGKIYNVPKMVLDSRIDALLSMFELLDRADDKVGGYSKGMRQRLALARTLIHDPEIVFLDEPTSGLDPVAAREVHDLIRSLRQQRRTVFLCTHNLLEAERLCDRVAVLAQGKVLALGTTRDLTAQLKHGHRIEVEIDRSSVERAVALLGNAPITGVDIAEMDGRENGDGATLTLHGVGRRSVPTIVHLLTGAGIDLYRVEPDDGSLEDVYFALEHENV